MEPHEPHSAGDVTDRQRSRKLLHGVRVLITLVVVGLAVVLGVRAFQHYTQTPWTRNGRVSAYVVDSAPEVGGRVVEVPVHDNQLVRKGDLLYRIDPRDYEAALRRARADVESATARLALQKENFERRLQLRTGDISAEERQSYGTSVKAAEADLDSAEAARYQAEVDLERCEVRSHVDGWVTNLTVRVGNYAHTGAQQMSVIDADSFWITGYFEETKLRHVQIGAPARAVLMSYPGTVVLGSVESISRGIADRNTAPNDQGLAQVDPVFTWVRLAQRIPVRIRIESVPEGVHLAIGETCTITLEPLVE